MSAHHVIERYRRARPCAVGRRHRRQIGDGRSQAAEPLQHLERGGANLSSRSAIKMLELRKRGACLRDAPAWMLLPVGASMPALLALDSYNAICSVWISSLTLAFVRWPVSIMLVSIISIASQSDANPVRHVLSDIRTAPPFASRSGRVPQARLCSFCTSVM